MGLVAIIWLKSESIASRRITGVLLRGLLVNPSTPDYALENFLHTCSPEQIVRRIRQIFINPVIAADPTQIAVELVAADAFVNIAHPSAPKYHDLKLDADVIHV